MEAKNARPISVIGQLILIRIKTSTLYITRLYSQDSWPNCVFGVTSMTSIYRPLSLIKFWFYIKGSIKNYLKRLYRNQRSK